MYLWVVTLTLLSLSILAHFGNVNSENEEIFKLPEAPSSGSGYPDSDSSSNSNAAPISEMNEADFQLPPGFQIIDGVLMDTTNLLVQQTTKDSTVYKKYITRSSLSDIQSGYQTDYQVLYRRPKRESGWRFIMFDDPSEFPGSGHMIVLQKILGFAASLDKNNPLSTLRLYEAFHIDLSDRYGSSLDNDISSLPNIDIGGQLQDENMPLDPNDFLLDTTQQPAPKADGIDKENPLENQRNLVGQEGQGQVGAQKSDTLGESESNVESQAPTLNKEEESYIPRGHESELDMAPASQNSSSTELVKEDSSIVEPVKVNDSEITMTSSPSTAEYEQSEDKLPQSWPVQVNWTEDKVPELSFAQVNESPLDNVTQPSPVHLNWSEDTDSVLTAAQPPIAQVINSSDEDKVPQPQLATKVNWTEDTLAQGSNPEDFINSPQPSFVQRNWSEPEDKTSIMTSTAAAATTLDFTEEIGASTLGVTEYTKSNINDRDQDVFILNKDKVNVNAKYTEINPTSEIYLTETEQVNAQDEDANVPVTITSATAVPPEPEVTESTFAYQNPTETTLMPDTNTNHPEINLLNDDVNNLPVTTFYFDDDYSLPPGGPNLLSTISPDINYDVDSEAHAGNNLKRRPKSKPVPRMKRNSLNLPL